MRFKTVAMWAGGLITISSLGAALWAAGDELGIRYTTIKEHRELVAQVQQHSVSLNLQRYQILRARQIQGTIRPEELLELCKLAEILRLKADGCR